MNIGGVFSEPNTTSVQNTNNTAAPAQVQQSGSANATVADLPVGETFSGKVLQRDGDLVQILLNDDSVLEAKLANDMQLQAGQLVRFAVKSNGQDGVALMPLFTNTAEMSTASKALMSAGLSQTGKNLQMVSDMMREGMPIGRDSLLFINKQITANPTANITDIVQMNRMGIPVTEANLEQFANYKEYEHQINAATDHIFSLVPETFEDLLSQGLKEEAVQLYKDILSLAVGENTGSEAAPEAVLQEGELPAEPQEILEDGQKQIIRDTLSPAEQPADGNAVSGQEEAALKTAAQEDTKTDALLNLLKSVSEGEQHAQSSTAHAGEGQNRSVQGLHPSFENAGITREEVSHLIGQLKQSGASPELLEALAKGELPAKDVLKFAKQLQASDETVSLLKNQAFQKLAKSELSAQWKITPEQASSKTQVEELYNKINEQTKQLMDSLHAAAKGDSPLANAVTNLQNNVDFMNQLNHMFPYIQLPLKMSGSEAHGDLYVYTNKKNLAKDDGSVSALLHLDMDHLGPMNVFVKMNQGNHVNTNFYLADEAALDLVAAHMDSLTERLQKRGYQVEAKYALNEEKINVMDEMIKQDRSITTISTTAFDARA